ncbi:MAG: Endonuclease/exonuclease/phosphatase [Actinotalea sp.]|nr:Endonuclease/exonuclease/phosphatase [Actinotalea sp.]
MPVVDNGHVPTTLRLMTYNIRQLKDDADAVASLLRESGADVVAIQEPPRGPLGGRRLARLAARAGYTAAVSGAGARTTALLVREGLPVTGTRAVPLPWRPPRTRRGLAVADVSGIRFISTHLSLVPAEREQHVGRLLRLVGAAAGGCVVAGDLNEDPGGPTWRVLTLHLRDAAAAVGPTFTARNPRRRLDAVLVSPGISASSARARRDETTLAASDHLPVVVDLTW